MVADGGGSDGIHRAGDAGAGTGLETGRRGGLNSRENRRAFFFGGETKSLSLIHISEPTRPY